jgi:formylglycine-generating enzyme required for sulfatase activity
VIVLGLAGGGWMWHRAEADAARRAAAEKARIDAEARQRAEALRTRQGERDCEKCPQMLRVEPGSFVMGSSAAEQGRFNSGQPQQRVTFARAFWLGKYEVTRGEFAAFVEASGYRRSPGAQVPGEATDYWRRPGFEQTDRDPVVNVTWEDAQAYVAWLSRTSGKTYRQPSEAEWEYAARAGTTTSFFWGDEEHEACRYANVGDFAFADGLKTSRRGLFPCTDGHVQTAPVGSFPANAWGFHDMLGNAQEWTMDCWNATYDGLPANGDARLSGDCYQRAVRGGSWLADAALVRSAARVVQRIGYTDAHVGFRVARSE